MLHSDLLRELIGAERSVQGVSHALHLAVTADHPPATGAVHVTCADECEHECADAFQRGFVRYLLPPLKSSHHAAMRLATLGAHYEWGTIRIAEDHFATAASHARHKLLVVKVNAHVAVEETPDGPSFGTLTRYAERSPCCGALHALLEGAHQPWVECLRHAFQSEGRDRLEALTDPDRVLPRERALRAALVSARLQARAVTLDVQDYEPVSPTLYVVLPCVTLNRPGPDGEIVVGLYVADSREDGVEAQYVGLGDDPEAYVIRDVKDSLVVTDGNVDQVRAARDHRQLALARWKDHGRAGRAPVTDPRLARLRRDVADNKHHHPKHGRLLLQGLLVLLAEVAPIPAAVMLFGYGASGIHHAFRVHQLARKVGGDAHARQMLLEIHDRVHRLPPEQAQAMVDLLMREYE